MTQYNSNNISTHEFKLASLERVINMDNLINVLTKAEER